MLSRRRFLQTLSASFLAAPRASEAQPAARVPTVGVLAPGFRETPATGQRSQEGFERGLKEAGRIPGSTIRVEYRYAEGSDLRLDALAGDLVGLSVDVIVARSSRAVQAAKKVTSNIPIVMAASGLDPVELGLVAGLARPGGNVTGLTLQNQELYVKHLELLHATVSRLSRVGLLGNPSIRIPPKGLQALEAGAKVLGIRLEHVQVRRAEDLEPAFAEMVRNKVDGVVVLADPFVLEANSKRVVSLVEKHRLPAIYWLHTYPEVGGLMSYGATSSKFTASRRPT